MIISSSDSEAKGVRSISGDGHNNSSTDSKKSFKKISGSNSSKSKLIKDDGKEELGHYENREEKKIYDDSALINTDQSNSNITGRCITKSLKTKAISSHKLIMSRRSTKRSRKLSDEFWEKIRNNDIQQKKNTFNDKGFENLQLENTKDNRRNLIDNLFQSIYSDMMNS